MSSCHRSLGLSKIFDEKDKEGDCCSRRQHGLPGCAGALLRFQSSIRTLAIKKNSGFHPADWGRLTRTRWYFLHSSYLMMGTILQSCLWCQPCFGLCSWLHLRNAILRPRSPGTGAAEVWQSEGMIRGQPLIPSASCLEARNNMCSEQK